MATPLIVADGTMVYGTPNSGVLTIDGTAYILENINIDRGDTQAVSREGRGIPNKQRLTADVPTLTADLQLADPTTPYPIFGKTFEVQTDPAYGVEKWIVRPTNFQASNSESETRVVPLRAVKCITGAVTLVNS